MDIREKKESGIIILGVSGRLDTGNAEALEQKLFGLIDGGESRFVIDCSALNYVSSAGLRLLLVAEKRLAARAGTIVVSGLTEQMREIFDIVGFPSIFQIYATTGEAVAALA